MQNISFTSRMTTIGLMKRSAVLLLIFMMLGLVSGAQPSRNRKIRVDGSLHCASRPESVAPQPGCRLIYELATPRAKDPRKSVIGYRFSIDADLHSSADSAGGIHGTVTVAEVGDLKMHEGFDLGAFILPAEALLRLEADGTEYTTRLHFIDSTATFHAAGVFNAVPGFSVDSVLFSPELLDQFFRGLASVRDYRAFAAIGREMSAQAAQRYSDPWQEFAALLWFDHLGEVAGQLAVWTAKGLAGQDPSEMAGIARSLGVEAYRRQLAFVREARMNSLAAAPFQAESVAWLGNQIELVLNHPESRNPYSTSFLNRLAVLGTLAGEGGLDRLMANVWPDGAVAGGRVLVAPFLSAVVADLHRRAIAGIELEKYNESLLFARNAACLARQANDAELLARSDQLVSQSHHGILAAWLTVAHRALQADNVALAQQYLQKATDYRAAHQEAIVSEEALNATLELFTDSCLQKATRLVARGDYPKAIAQLDIASAYLSKLTYYSRRSQFEFVRTQACTRHYEDQLNKAVEGLDGSERQHGRTLLRQAVAFRLNYPAWVTQREEEKIALKLIGLLEADSLLTLAATADTNHWPALFPLIDRAASLLDTLYPVNTDTVGMKFGRLAVAQVGRSVRLLENEVAMDAYQKAGEHWNDLRGRFRLYASVSDSLFLPDLNRLETLGLKISCRLSRNWGKALTDAAYDAAIAKEFQQALALVVDARKLYRENPGCDHDTVLLDQISRRYREVWLFMAEIARVDTLLAQQKVEEAVAWFDLNRTNYDRNFLKLADMPAPRLETYLTKHPLPELIEVVMQRMFYKTSTSQLIALFETLRQQNIPPSQLNQWLPELGNLMAADYHQAGEGRRSDPYLAVFKVDREWYQGASERYINNVADNWFERKWLKIKLMI